MNLLVDTLSDAWRERRDFYVGGNMAIYFSETQAAADGRTIPIWG